MLFFQQLDYTSLFTATYGMVFFCIFILIPFVYFFYEEKEEEGFESNNVSFFQTICSTLLD